MALYGAVRQAGELVMQAPEPAGAVDDAARALRRLVDGLRAACTGGPGAGGCWSAPSPGPGMGPESGMPARMTKLTTVLSSFDGPAPVPNAGK
jgi:hypothetical protein